MENGKIIKCMEKVSLDGQMEGCIQGNIFRTKSMVMEKWSGRIKKYTRVIGKKAFKMVREK